MAEREYIRLTRGRRQRRGFVTALPGARSSLWLGADHLLKASATFSSEEYRRFYFRDIQAITIRESNRRMYLNIAFAALVSLAPLWIYYVGGRSFASTFFTAIAFVLFGIPLLINNILGATCDVQLKTAVQTEELPSLSRIRQTRRVLDRIRPLIVAAQGSLPSEELSARLRAAAPPAVASRSTTSPLGLSSMPASPASQTTSDPPPAALVKDADIP